MFETDLRIQFHFLFISFGLKVLSLGCVATAWSRVEVEEGGSDAYQGACDVDAAIAEGGVIQPFWLGEAEESVA